MSEKPEITPRQFTIIDLTDIRDLLGDHYRHNQKDTYTGTCDCGEQVGQDVDACQFCGRSIVWRRSRLWKQLYGNPEDAIRRLSTIPPVDEAGKHLCQAAGVTGFADVGEARRWSRSVKKVGQKRALGAVNYVSKKHKQGRGMIAHALNIVEKAAREAEDEHLTSEEYAAKKGLTFIE